VKRKLLWLLVVVAVALIWAWYDLQTKPANERLQAGVRKIILMEPRVKPLFDEAMKDGVLTTLEANAIVGKATELKRR